MKNIITWIKENKVSAILIIAVLYLVSTNYSSPIAYNSLEKVTSIGSFGKRADPLVSRVPTTGATPRLDVTDRKVVTNSTLSLVVVDVSGAIKKITKYAQDNSGYMVNASQTAPEGLANGTISIRVPSEMLEETLEYLRGASVKVVSENITGRDITDQFMDIEARLATLNGTKARYESILDKATDVNEILNVTQQILYVQDQIDNLKGQIAYMDATSKSSLITIYLSTDEFELPYSPDQPWRPSLIFKYAVRSLVQSLRDAGNLAIWVGVYAVIWVPALIIVIIAKKRRAKKILP